MDITKLSSFKFYIFVISVVVMFGCKARLSADKPEEVFEQRSSFERKESYINVPIKASVSAIENQLNNYLKGVIYEDISFSNNNHDNLTYKVSKYSDLSFEAKNQDVKLTLPLSISGIYKKLGVNIKFNGIIKAKYTTTVKLKDNWEVATVTKSNGYEWVKEPKVSVIGVGFSVGWIVDVILISKLDYVNNAIDRAINDNLNLKDLVRPGIEALVDPINVSETYNTWFKITPVEIYATQLESANDTINIGIGLKAYTETLIGEKPSVEVVVDSIPFKSVDKLQDDFNMGIVSVLSYDAISEMLHKEYVSSGYEYVQGKHRIKFNKMNIYSNKDELIIEVGMYGSVTGDIYMRGKPVYDSVTRNIELSELDFDFDSEQKLLKSADWLVHGALRRIMKKYMVYPVGTDLDAVKLEMQEYLNNYEPVKGVVLNGQLGDVAASDLYLVKDAIILVVGVNGKLEVTVSDMD